LPEPERPLYGGAICIARRSAGGVRRVWPHCSRRRGQMRRLKRLTGGTPERSRAAEPPWARASAVGHVGRHRSRWRARRKRRASRHGPARGPKRPGRRPGRAGCPEPWRRDVGQAFVTPSEPTRRVSGLCGCGDHRETEGRCAVARVMASRVAWTGHGSWP
jgi:hypothetical protein